MLERSSTRTEARQLTLAALPAAVPRVRRLAGHVLTEYGLTGMSDTALLLVSELVTNAVRASADPREEIALTLSLTGGSLLIEVWDPHPIAAVPRYPDATSESGRGLFVVEALASRWGQRQADGGKVVWCELDIPAAGEAGTGPNGAVDALPHLGNGGGRA